MELAKYKACICEGSAEKPLWTFFWICKSDKHVSLSNMYDDYKIRPELLKSKQYYNNAFQTAVNYDELMRLKRKLKK